MYVDTDWAMRLSPCSVRAHPCTPSPRAQTLYVLSQEQRACLRRLQRLWAAEQPHQRAEPDLDIFPHPYVRDLGTCKAYSLKHTTNTQAKVAVATIWGKIVQQLRVEASKV